MIHWNRAKTSAQIFMNKYSIYFVKYVFLVIFPSGLFGPTNLNKKNIYLEKNSCFSDEKIKKSNKIK